MYLGKGELVRISFCRGITRTVNAGLLLFVISETIRHDKKLHKNLGWNSTPKWLWEALSGLSLSQFNRAFKELRDELCLIETDTKLIGSVRAHYTRITEIGWRQLEIRPDVVTARFPK